MKLFVVMVLQAQLELKAYRTTKIETLFSWSVTAENT